MDANGDVILNGWNWECDFYYDPSNCGDYDTVEFVANDMCCVCGGGAVPNEDDGQDLENIQIDADQLEEYELYIKVGLDHLTGDALSIHQWVTLEELREAVEGSQGESDEESQGESDEEEEGCAHVGYEDSGYGRREWCETPCVLAGG